MVIGDGDSDGDGDGDGDDDGDSDGDGDSGDFAAGWLKACQQWAPWAGNKGGVGGYHRHLQSD